MSDMNQDVQPQKIARVFTFQILEVAGLYSLCSQNKDADQLHGYRAADLHLCYWQKQKADFLKMQLVCHL